MMRVIETVNGREILSSKPAKSAHVQIVLARWGANYVTWERNVNTDEFYWGHYFGDYDVALADYDIRS